MQNSATQIEASNVSLRICDRVWWEALERAELPSSLNNIRCCSWKFAVAHLVYLHSVLLRPARINDVCIVTRAKCKEICLKQSHCWSLFYGCCFPTSDLRTSQNFSTPSGFLVFPLFFKLKLVTKLVTTKERLLETLCSVAVGPTSLPTQAWFEGLNICSEIPSNLVEGAVLWIKSILDITVQRRAEITAVFSDFLVGIAVLRTATESHIASSACPFSFQRPWCKDVVCLFLLFNDRVFSGICLG